MFYPTECEQRLGWMDFEICKFEHGVVLFSKVIILTVWNHAGWEDEHGARLSENSCTRKEEERKENETNCKDEIGYDGSGN